MMIPKDLAASHQIKNTALGKRIIAHSLIKDVRIHTPSVSILGHLVVKHYRLEMNSKMVNDYNMTFLDVFVFYIDGFDASECKTAFEFRP